jgi:beta-lactamase class A
MEFLEAALAKPSTEGKGRRLRHWRNCMRGLGRRAVALSFMGFAASPALAQSGSDDQVTRTILEVEQQLKARLGVVLRDLETGRSWTHKADERFAMCSTFKALAAAAILARVDRGEEDLARRVVFHTSDLVTYSPVTKEHVGGEGMPMGEICAAAVTLSDNTAGNLMLKALGGPEGLTRFLRSIGDEVSRLDRRETELNEATPGDPRDTTTPNALTATMQKLALGTVLSAKSREQFTAWLVANKTGEAKVRAGVPKEWRVGDKTGAGELGTNNDTGIIWPILFTILTTETTASVADKNAGMADIARALAAALAG